MIFLGFAAFASEMKKRDFFAKKSSHFLKMDILFLSFFSERAHFFFQFLFCVGYKKWEPPIVGPLKWEPWCVGQPNDGNLDVWDPEMGTLIYGTT